MKHPKNPLRKRPKRLARKDPRSALLATKASKSDGITEKVATIAEKVAGRNRKRAKRNPKKRRKQNNIAIKRISDYNNKS